MPEVPDGSIAPPRDRSYTSPKGHALLRLIAGRLFAGIVILFVVSLLIFFATQVLPGNAATAVLGHSATPDRVHDLERQLHLNQGMAGQYWFWYALHVA